MLINGRKQNKRFEKSLKMQNAKKNNSLMINVDNLLEILLETMYDCPLNFYDQLL